jgi:3-hydroxyacyl-CoA dehydrogenase/3-hydroxy-2-methylbutyryl-CoA dehydrogenase
MQIKDKVAIVTGGASGLGEATVKNIVAQGGKAVILDMNESGSAELVKELGDSAIFFKTDVSSEEDVQKAVNGAIERFGSIDFVINCAGFGIGKKVYSNDGPHPLKDFSRVIEVNLIGTFNVIRLAVEKMVNNEPNDQGERGVIIITSSVAAFEGGIGQAAYSASKGGMVGMTLPIARELAAHGIRVVTIAPGLFETPIYNTTPEKIVQSLKKITPFPKRFGYPEEFAHMVQCVIENPMLNGCTLRIDGAIRM